MLLGFEKQASFSSCCFVSVSTRDFRKSSRATSSFTSGAVPSISPMTPKEDKLFPKSFGMKIFVARPSETSFIASIDFNRRTASFTPAFAIFFKPSASASYTNSIDLALPSANAIAASRSASAAMIFAALSPSASVTTDSLCACACKTASRRSRSAFICFVIASSISFGGVMFLSSTRVTFNPHSSVALSRVSCILALISSLDDKVVSNSILPITLRNVVAVKFCNPNIGSSTPYVYFFTSKIFAYTTESTPIETLSFVMTFCGGKSYTCSFRETFFTIRSINGILICIPASQVEEYCPKRSITILLACGTIFILLTSRIATITTITPITIIFYLFCLSGNLSLFLLLLLKMPYKALFNTII